MPYLEDDPAIDYLDEPDPDAVPLGRDGKPLVPRPAAIAPPSLGAPPVAHPVGAGDQPTIREIIAQSQPQPPAVSPDQEEMNGAVGAVKDAQAKRAASLQSRPTTPEPKWWQRLAAGAAGAAAGYTNAAGRTHVDPSKAIAGIYGVPGQQRKMENWQKQYEGAQADTENAQQNLTTLQRIRAMQTAEQRAASDQEEKHARAQKETEYNETMERTRIAGQNEKLEQAMLKPWGEDVQLQKEGEPVPQGMEVTQSLTQPGMVYVHPPRNVAITEDLAPYAPGRKSGQMVPYSEFKTAQKRANDDLIRNTNKPLPPDKEDPNHWMADAVNTDPKISGPAKAKLKEYQRLHPNTGGVDGGSAVNVPPRNPTLAVDQRDEGVIASRPTGEQAVIKQLVGYKYPLPTGIALSKPYWQNILQLAAQYDPSFDASQYSNRQKLRNSFMSGQDSQAISALNTVNHHIARLEANWKALNNSGGLMTPTNAVANTVGSVFGDKRLNRFQLDQEAVSNELMRVWRQVGASEAEIKNWAAKLSPNLSPQAQQGAIEELYELVSGKLRGLKSKYETGMGKPADFRMLSPEMAKAFKDHGVEANDLAPGATYQNAQQGGPAPSQEKVFPANQVHAYAAAHGIDDAAAKRAITASGYVVK